MRFSLLILADIAAEFLCVVIAVYVFIKRQWEKLDIILVLAAVACSYTYWQLTAPMMRYGYAYVLLLAALMAGYLLQYSRMIVKVAYVFLVVYGVYKLYICVDEIIQSGHGPY